MEYFTERGNTHTEVMEKLRDKYGDRAKVLTRKNIRMGGFLGIFAREGVEVSGYIANNPAQKRHEDIEKEKDQILKSARTDQALRKVLEEVQSLKAIVGEKNKEPLPQEEAHPSIRKIEEILAQNEFSYAYIQRMLARLKRELALEDLDNYSMVQDAVVEWIAESIQVYNVPEEGKPKIFILVGPTGVGKTTTVAKLAAIYGVGNGSVQSQSVRMITIDNYRIGAQTQIQTYGDIMGIPVAVVENVDELSKKIALYDDIDLILIDTIGKSPRDYVKLAEMRQLLDGCGNRAEIFLTMSATTKISDVAEIMRQFEPFQYNSVILTKLDETMRIGNIISALNRVDKPISFLTDGQVVPQDISKATVLRLLMTLEGFKVNQDRITRKYDAGSQRKGYESRGNETESEGITMQEHLALRNNPDRN